MWYDNAGALSVFSLFVLSLPAEVLQVLQYMYRVHDPAITIAIGSVWLQLSWKRGKTNSLAPDDRHLQVPQKKKLHVQLVYESDKFQMWKKKCLFVMFLSYLSMSYKNKTDDSWVYRTMRKYKWDRQTGRHRANFMFVKSKPTDWDTCMYIKICYFFHKKRYWNVQMYKKTAATAKHF